jgi:N-acetylglucosaminyldiphosphoundecaprenol N-acetyl-beta-D-mannosaminyltransferase
MTRPIPTRHTLAGARVDAISLDDAVDHLVALSTSRAPGRARYVVTPNAQHVVLLQRDERLRRAYEEAELSVADGMSVVYAASLLERPVRGRVNGTDLMERLAARAATAGRSVYLLGGRPGAAAQAAQVLAGRYPGLRIAGTDCPPMGFEADAAALAGVLERLAAASPDLVFVGLGAPKQEYLMREALRGEHLGVALGIGGSFELIAGQLPRAPVWMQRVGLEWSFRLMVEPRRLLKRYVVGNSRFVALVAEDALRARVARRG